MVSLYVVLVLTAPINGAKNTVRNARKIWPQMLDVKGVPQLRRGYCVQTIYLNGVPSFEFCTFVVLLMSQLPFHKV